MNLWLPQGRPNFGPGPVPRVYPKDSVSVNVTAPAAQDTMGAWATVVTPANQTDNFVLCGASFSKAASASEQFATEIGTGAIATPPTKRDSVTWGYVFADPTVDSTAIFTAARLVEPQYIPAGTGIAARFASSLAAAWSGHHIYVYGFVAPSPFVAAKWIDYMQYMQGHGCPTLGGDRLPNTGFLALVHSGAAWTGGAWQTVVDPVPNDCLVQAVHGTNNSAGVACYVELAVGAAGSEKLLPATLPFAKATGITPHCDNVPVPFSLFVPKGARLSARQRATGTAGTIKIAVKIAYLK